MYFFVAANGILDERNDSDVVGFIPYVVCRVLHSVLLLGGRKEGVRGLLLYVMFHAVFVVKFAVPCYLDYVTSMETCETRKRDGGNIIGAEVTTMETSKRRIDIYGIHDLLLMETR